MHGHVDIAIANEVFVADLSVAVINGSNNLVMPLSHCILLTETLNICSAVLNICKTVNWM